MEVKKLQGNEDYDTLKRMAMELNINWVGKTKDFLMEAIQEKLNEQGESQVTTLNQENENQTVQNEQVTQNEEVQENIQNQEMNVSKTEEQQKPKRQVGKWYEQPGAFPYKKGDIVKIVKGEHLVGRLYMIHEPSTKRFAARGQLLHPKTGELQKTVFSVELDRLEKTDLTYEQAKQLIVEQHNQKQQQKEAELQK